MKSDYVQGYARGIMAGLLLAWAIAACAAAYVPSGVPGCPERQQWSDSAQACLPPRGAAKGEG